LVHNQKHNHISNLGILYACNIGGNKMKQKTKKPQPFDLNKEDFKFIDSFFERHKIKEGGDLNYLSLSQ